MNPRPKDEPRNTLHVMAGVEGGHDGIPGVPQVSTPLAAHHRRRALSVPELVEGVLPQVQQYQAGRGENIPDAQPVDDSYDARRLEENRRKVEDKMSRQGLVPKVY